MVEVARMSPVSGKVNKMDLPITLEDYQLWLKGGLIQAIMPKLTPEQREFIKTGIMPDEWDTIMKDQEK
jgi:hypothetical protein